MGFGNQLFQLAQGIIANEQRRQQLEAAEERQEQVTKQAERSFQLRKKEVDARQGFLDIQQKQLENKVTEQASPEAQRKRTLELDFLEARIESMRATARVRGEGKEPDPTKLTRLGQESDRIKKSARTARTDLAIRNILDGETSPPGVDPLVAEEGLEGAGVRSWEGLNAAVESAQKDVRSLEVATNIPEEFKVPQLKERIIKRDALVASRAEIQKVFDSEVTQNEFRRAAPSAFPDAFVNELFDTSISVEARKLDIWGDGVFSSGRNQMLDVAVDQFRKGSATSMEAFVRLFPETILDNEGRIPKGTATKMALYFQSEGIPADATRDFIRVFNARSF